MAGASLPIALAVNFTIGVVKLIAGILSGSSAMVSEAYHSFADTFNQILLLLGIYRSKAKPDHTHPFGYSKVQFFWAFIVAVLIFGISGTLALLEGIEILQHPEEHGVPSFNLFLLNIIVLSVAIVLETIALRQAYLETKEYQEKYEIETFPDTLEEMQDPVLLSLLVEDTLALLGLIIALVGVTLTYVLHMAILDGLTSVAIGLLLMVGGILLARENKRYLIGKAVSNRVQAIIDEILEEFPGISKVNSVKTMLLGPDDMILALDVIFTQEARTTGYDGIADDIDKLESILAERIEILTPEKIFVESQLIETPKAE